MRYIPQPQRQTYHAAPSLLMPREQHSLMAPHLSGHLQLPTSSPAGTMLSTPGGKLHSPLGFSPASPSPTSQGLQLATPVPAGLREYSQVDFQLHRFARTSSWLRPGLQSSVPDAAYTPEAFYVENATLGQWRQTVQQFHERLDFDLASPKSSPASDTVGDSDLGSDLSDTDGMAPLGGGDPRWWRLSGMRRWSPELYHWMMSRVGTRSKVCLVTSFVAFEAMKFLLAEQAYAEGVNTFSLLVVTNFLSLLLALWLSLLLEGGQVIRKLLSWHAHVRFMGVAVLFTVASALLLLAYRIGTPHAEVVTAGYIYMPFSVILSYYVFRRRYGRLEWLSVGMMTLAILTFVLLREESKKNGRDHVQGFQVTTGFGLVVGAVGVSVLASILAERIFKAQSLDSLRGPRGQRQDKFYVMKVHLDFSLLLISCALWSAPTSAARALGDVGDFFEQWSHSRDWFGTWGPYQCLMVVISVGQGWAAGLITKEFSTVIKSIVQTLSVIIMMLLSDPIMGNRFHFTHREAPSVMLVIITLMSAMIFQTGRINLRVIRKAMNLGPEAHPDLKLDRLPRPENDETSPPPQSAPPQPERPPRSSSCSSDDGATDTERTTWKPLLDPQQQQQEQDKPQSWCSLLSTYALILLYIVADGSRTILIQKSLSTTVINNTSMTLAICVCGLMAGSTLTLYTDGWRGLREAWQPVKILGCFPAAFLFALATTLNNMAYSLGISASLSVVLGKFYVVVAVLGARWIMEKYYMWLEWFALLILTLASGCFGYLKAIEQAEKRKEAHTDKEIEILGFTIHGHLLAVVLVLCSSAVSALASLVTEKILKGDSSPFHLKKVRLDCGSVVACALLLPIMGAIATSPQDVPWVERPYSMGSCPVHGHPENAQCWNLHNGTCSNPECHCDCTEGVFAGWNDVVLLLALLVNTTQGWLVGQITQQFSTVHRAIADSFTLLGLYFGEPLWDKKATLNNMGLNLVAFIVPLSTATFSVATSEMQKVMQAQSRIFSKCKSSDAGTNEYAQTDSESEESELSDLGSRLGPAPVSFSARSSLPSREGERGC